MGRRHSKAKKKKASVVTRPAVSAEAPQQTAPQKTGPEIESANLKPKPAGNERLEDVAVLTNVARQKLSEELRLECEAVLESISLVSAGDYDAANERLKHIARTSPYADWRLFLRGLCAFYQKDFETARQNWQRLDLTRRPARMAATLLAATAEPPLNDSSMPPARLVETAKLLLYRSKTIAVAKEIAAVKHRDAETVFSASQSAMLGAFYKMLVCVDAEFVNKFSQACVQLASTQDDPKCFQLLSKAIPGPQHDPHWRLQEFRFMGTFEELEKERSAVALEYIEKDLPRIEQFTDELKRALSSCMMLAQARYVEKSVRARPLYRRVDEPDFEPRLKLLRNAISFYPQNRDAHLMLLEVLEQQERCIRSNSPAQADKVEQQMFDAKEAFVAVFPSEIEVALSLVDHYFDTDRLEKANALVQELSRQRLDSPLAKALPWKLSLLKAMYESRRKKELVAVRALLADADSQWPTWLDKTWLPFLIAAVELRAGDEAKFEELDKQARQAAGVSQTVGDFMTFAAIQQLNVPAAILKPYRQSIGVLVDNAEGLLLEDLLVIGAFFWDLSRTGLEHKAHRAQSSKIGKAICGILGWRANVPPSPTLIKACAFCASRNFWNNSNNVDLPDFAAKYCKTGPLIFAAFLQRICKLPAGPDHFDEYSSELAILEQAAKTEKDAFNRHYFETVLKRAEQLADELERELADQRAMDSFNPFAEFEDDDFEDNECQCDECRAARRLMGSLEDDEDEDEDYGMDDFNAGLPGMPAATAKVLTRIASKLGPDGFDRFGRLLAEATTKAQDVDDDELKEQILVDACLSAGLSARDAREFLGAMIMQALEGSFDDDEEQFADQQFADFDSFEPTPTRPTMSAAERKADAKRRRKELEKRKRR